ncbi:MAG: GGDEF domain-containing protein [Pirellulales bacterium]|nr:GGDEF domain-containing protein [Pirellulales bacterium]
MLLVVATAQAALAVGLGLWLASWLSRWRERSSSKCFSQPDAPGELSLRLEQLEAEYAHAQRQLLEQARQLESVAAEALTDGLTGLPNRRAFDDELDRCLALTRRYDRPLSLLLCDIDHFKKFNDRYGHPTGDFVLRETAQLLRSTLRPSDFVARFGGEEFAILLPETGLADAIIAAEKLRLAVCVARPEFDGQKFQITVSQGVTQATRNDGTAAFVRRADAALYAAKSAGRNCVHYHDGELCRAMRLDDQGLSSLDNPADALALVGDEIRQRLAALTAELPSLPGKGG